MNGNEFEVVYVPWNEYFVIKLDRNDLDLIHIVIRTELKRYTVKGLKFNYHLPPFRISADDTFVYIGDIDHRIVQRNPYGCIDPRVSIVDRYTEVKDQFTGFVVDTNDTPLVPKNICHPVSQSPLSIPFETVEGNTFKLKGRKKKDNVAFTLNDGFSLKAGESIAVLAADNHLETLMIAQEIREFLAEDSTLNVISEAAMNNMLPLYPASLLDDDTELSHAQLPTISQIGESLGADYVYVIARKKAVEASQDKILWIANQTHIWEYGVLCETQSSGAAGFTDYYIITKERSFLGKQYDLSDYRSELEKEYREFTVKLSEPIARAIIDSVE